MTVIIGYKYIKNRMMADPNGYSNGKVHVEGMATWKLFDKVEELENGLKSVFEKIENLEKQVNSLITKKKN